MLRVLITYYANPILNPLRSVRAVSPLDSRSYHKTVVETLEPYSVSSGINLIGLIVLQVVYFRSVNCDRILTYMYIIYDGVQRHRPTISSTSVIPGLNDPRPSRYPRSSLLGSPKTRKGHLPLNITSPIPPIPNPWRTNDNFRSFYLQPSQ